jgi:hypothetical protein
MNRVVAPDSVFLDALRREDSLGAVVRAHIHVEARLIELIETLVASPEHLPRLQYEQRANLAVALGLDPRLLPALKAFGHLRNTFAHRLDVELTMAMVDSLFEAFAEADRQNILNAYGMTGQQLGETWPPFPEADARQKFMIIAITFDRYLEAAIDEVRHH